MKDGPEAHMVLWGELRVQATLENLRKVSDFVRDIGRELRLTEEGLDFDLAVEEASANIVRHAYRPVRPGTSCCAWRPPMTSCGLRSPTGHSPTRSERTLTCMLCSRTGVKKAHSIGRASTGARASVCRRLTRACGGVYRRGRARSSDCARSSPISELAERPGTTSVNLACAAPRPSQDTQADRPAPHRRF